MSFTDPDGNPINPNMTVYYPYPSRKELYALKEVWGTPKAATIRRAVSECLERELEAEKIRFEEERREASA